MTFEIGAYCNYIHLDNTSVTYFKNDLGPQMPHWDGAARGRSLKWPMEGVLRLEIVKGGGFEGPEVLQIHARKSLS